MQTMYIENMLGLDLHYVGKLITCILTLFTYLSVIWLKLFTKPIEEK